VGDTATGAVTAVSQSIYSEAAVAQWHFPQENATFRKPGNGALTVEPL
jgi:hypothetical protein